MEVAWNPISLLCTLKRRQTYTKPEESKFWWEFWSSLLAILDVSHMLSSQFDAYELYYFVNLHNANK